MAWFVKGGLKTMLLPQQLLSWCRWLLLLIICGVGFAVPLATAQDFLAPEKAFAMKARQASPDVVLITFDIARGYYMYRDRFELESPDITMNINDVSLPPGVVKYDPTFEKEMALFFQSVEFALRLPAEWPGSDPASLLTINIISQGCADAGICYPPMTSAIVLAKAADGYQLVHQQAIVDDERPIPATLTSMVAGESLATTSESGIRWQALLGSSDDQGFVGALSGAATWQVIALFFALGVLLAFTPCVLPMIPILSVLIVGQGTPVTRGRGLALAAAYVLGMSLIYTLLGVLAGLSGVGLAAWLQTPWVLSTFAVLLLLFGLAMFDVIRLEMPGSVQTKLTQTASSLKGGRVWAAFLMGAISALIVGPCVAAPLAGALLYISQSGDVVLGGSVLFAMAWGMGLPLLLVGASAGSLLPKAGAWMNGVKAFFGVLLFATAWWMLNPVLPDWIEISGWAGLAGLSAVLLGAFDPLPSRLALGAAVRKTLGLVLALLAIVWIVGLASGGRSLFEPLKHLTNAGGNAAGQAELAVKPTFEYVKTVQALEQRLAASTQPVMLDFYADWCVSCKEMERFTFSDPIVAGKMQQMLLLKADVTANNSDDRALLKRFRLFGPPGIIFFEPGGHELKQIRVVGFQNATKFAEILDQVIAPK
jgi:thiol:disulfide interchange protein DsbD